MTAVQRPKLYDRPERARSRDRNTVRIPALCEMGERTEDTFVTNISAEGCKVLATTVGAVKSQPLVLRFAGEEPVTARLKWIKSASVGVAFDRPLAADVLERISALVAPDNVVPLRRNRFG